MKIIPTLLFLIVLAGCKKDDKTVLIAEHYFIAGQTGDSVSYSDYKPDYTINYAKTGCHHYTGVNTINIDLDSINDFIISYDYLYADILNECNYCPLDSECPPNGHQIISLQKINSKFQIAVDSSDIIRAFALKERISNSSCKWSANATLYFINTNFSTWDNSKWINVSEKYIGVRYINPDTIYGWIKVSFTADTLTFKDGGFKMKY